MNEFRSEILPKAAWYYHRTLNINLAVRCALDDYWNEAGKKIELSLPEIFKFPVLELELMLYVLNLT